MLLFMGCLNLGAMNGCFFFGCLDGLEGECGLEGWRLLGGWRGRFFGELCVK